MCHLEDYKVDWSDKTREIPYGPGHPSYIAPLPLDLVDLLRGREFDGKFERKPEAAEKAD